MGIVKQKLNILCWLWIVGSHKLTSYCSGVKIKVLADAAENYTTVLAENRKMFNEIQELKGATTWFHSEKRLAHKNILRK